MLKEYASYGSVTVQSNQRENLKALTFLCHTMKFPRECNYLANLCVLFKYNADQFAPCSLFLQSQINDYKSNDGTRRIKPNLFYKTGRSTVDDLNKVLDQTLVLQRSRASRAFLEGHGLNFSVLEYSLEGDLQKFTTTNLNFLNFCAPKNGLFQIRFPQNYETHCQVSLQEAYINNRQMGFYSVFFRYRDNKINLLKRIPVLIRSLTQDNAKNDHRRWQFVTRFYTLDADSGLRANYQDDLYTNVNIRNKFDHIRLVRAAQLRFIVKERNKISCPILILDYETVSNLTTTAAVDFHFSVTFEKDMDFDTILEIVLPILVLLGLIMSIVETFSYKIREGKVLYDVQLLGKFVIQLLSKIANTLFIIGAALAIYVHVTYKSQEVVRLLLPNSIEVEIKYFLLVALLLKVIKLAEHLWGMANVDIFFVDWERPKLADNFVAKNHLETPTSMGSRMTTHFENNNVSAWRNYFIANEWQELTTRRQISLFLHMLSVIVCLFIVGMENYTSSRFFFHLRRENEDLNFNTILNVSTGILVYAVCYVSQRLLNTILWERYIRNPIQQFIDCCSIANVSVFVLSQSSYGSYIHGRSPHGFSDTDMCSMILQFKREEENMCGHRGLLPGSEQQTYRILVPKNLRIFYDRLVMPLQKPGFFMNSHQNGNGVDGSVGKTHDRATFERTSTTYQNINRFLMAFIDHVRTTTSNRSFELLLYNFLLQSLKDLDYIVRERTILENILNTELELSTVSEGKCPAANISYLASASIDIDF